MHPLVVALGEADFYNDAAKLQCHAILNTTICSQHGFGFAADDARVDVNTLHTRGLVYRVSRPLYLDINLCCERPVSHAASNIGRLAQQASSDQFWCQLNFRTVSVHEGSDGGTSNTPSPFVLGFCLGLEHVEHGNTQPSFSQEGSASALNVNDINYPDCLEIATVTRVSLRLRVQSKHFNDRSAEGIQSVGGALGGDATTGLTYLQDFVDAAIRCSVSSARHRLAPGIRRAMPGFQHTLQTTFPTIFSPLGFQYLAERHPFISRVAENILRCVNASRRALPTSLETDHGLSFEDIEARLWDCLATGARHPQGRLVLKPLIPPDQSSHHALLHRDTSRRPPGVSITDLLDCENASYLSDLPVWEGVLLEPQMIEAHEVKEPGCSEQTALSGSTCNLGAAESMFIDDECPVPNGHLLASAQPEADEVLTQIWDDTVDGVRLPSQSPTHLFRPNATFSDDGCSRPDVSSTWSYMLDMFSPSEIPSGEKILKPSISFADLDPSTPDSTQDSGFRIPDISRQQASEMLQTSPILEEILSKDNVLGDTGKIYSIDPAAGMVDVITDNCDRKIVDDSVQPVYANASSSLEQRLSTQSDVSSNYDIMDFALFQLQDQDAGMTAEKSLEDYHVDDEMLFD